VGEGQWNRQRFRRRCGGARLLRGQAMVFTTTGQHFLATPELLEEVFGPAALLIECSSTDELVAMAKYIDGQLTATLQVAQRDMDLARVLVPLLERKAGRLLVNGFPRAWK